jgi:pantothenate synthetase
MAEAVAAEPLAELDYAEVVDPTTLAPLTRVAGDARLVIAARVGSTRLIDNLGTRT